MTVEFWADAKEVENLLPDGLRPRSSESARCFLHFTDNQYTSDALEERTDPALSQYMECFIVVEALWRDREVGFVPYIFVDNDNSMVRGWIQGLPKQHGVVRMSRPFVLDSPASSRVERGGEFYACLSHRDRRLIDAQVCLEEEVDSLPLPREVLNYRHFASLERTNDGVPAVYDLVGQKRKDVRFSTIWSGTARLEFGATPWHEIVHLAPLRVGRGFRYTRAMSVDDIESVAKLQVETLGGQA